MLAGLTQKGLRVLALASRRLAAGGDGSAAAVAFLAMDQGQVERGMRFMGLAVMANPLRADTPSVIRQLQAAALRPVRPRVSLLCLYLALVAMNPSNASRWCLVPFGCKRLTWALMALPHLGRR